MNIDLQAFCDEFQSNKRINMPFVIEGRVYATDGKLCIRMAAASWDGPTIEGNPKAAELPWEKCQDEPCFLWTRGPKAMRQCPSCHGTKLQRAECGMCEGAGYVDCPTCGGEMDCKSCNGKGYTAEGPCKTCDGTGETLQSPPVRVSAEKEIAAHYADLMESLPGLRICGQVQLSQVVFFTFDGGAGCVALREAKP